MAETTTEEGLLSTAEAARFLGLSPSSVRELVRRGILGCFRSTPGSKKGKFLFSKSELQHFLGVIVEEGGERGE